MNGLKPYDAVFFANTTGDLGIPDLKAFLDWIAAGHAFLGAHSASDTYHDEPSYLAMLGGEFATHGAIASADIKVDDATDLSVAHLAPRFQITDELYRFTQNNRAQVHVLLSMDRNPADRAIVALTGVLSVNLNETSVSAGAQSSSVTGTTFDVSPGVKVSVPETWT